MQINGTLLDDEWCAFFKEHNFLIGISIDGPRELHDVYRVDKGGKPTFDKVTRGIRLPQKQGVEYNILTTVNRVNGDLYACVHFVEPNYLLGNIRQEHMIDLIASPQQLRFGQDKLDSLPRYCLDCEVRFAKKAHAEDKPFFVWWNSTHTHVWTRIPKEAEGISGQGFYNDAMVLHDQQVGLLLDTLDELGLAEDTIVLYSNDNGPHYNTWPDGAISPWRSEKNSNWEGAYRVPKIFNLRRDPFERADENSNGYWDWVLEHIFAINPMQALAAEQLQSFKEFPPRQKPAAFNLDSVIAKMEESTGGGLR